MDAIVDSIMPDSLFDDPRTLAERRADEAEHKYDSLRAIGLVCGALAVVGFLFLGVALGGSYYKLAQQRNDQIAGVYTNEAFNHQALDTINGLREDQKLDSVKRVKDNDNESLIAAWEGCSQRLYSAKSWDAKDCTYNGLAKSFGGKVHVDAYPIDTNVEGASPEENAPSQEQLKEVLKKASDSDDKRKRSGEDAPYTGTGKPRMLDKKASHVYVYLAGDGKGEWVVYTYSILQ